MQNEQLLHLDSFDAECMSGGVMSASAGMTSTRWSVMSAAYDGQVSSLASDEARARHDSLSKPSPNHSRQHIMTSQQV